MGATSPSAEMEKRLLKAATSTSTSSSGGEGAPPMDKLLLKAASCGDSTSMKAMASRDPSILLGTTPSGNTCLHISSIHGHQGFCNDVLDLEESLLAAINLDGETLLIAAVRNAHVSLASFLLGRCCRQPAFRQALLQQDRYGFNALHHAIRNGHKDLALELIAAGPALSQAVSKRNESPMFFAVMRGFIDIFKKLIQTPSCAYSGGQHGRNWLHAAVINGDQDIAKIILEKRPELANEADNISRTPVRQAVLFGKIEMIRVMLEHDSTLGYQIHSNGGSLLNSAAFRGQVSAAQELLKHCPDAPYEDGNGDTFLHKAVYLEDLEFVEFVLRNPILRKLVNVQNNKGKTALHYAVQKCNPRIVAALLSHKDIDAAILDNDGNPADWELSGSKQHAKTLNWVQSLSKENELQGAKREAVLELNQEEEERMGSRKEQLARRSGVSVMSRSYYRCTNPRCNAKKQVERATDEPDTLVVTYEGLHLHYTYSHFLQHPTTTPSAAAAAAAKKPKLHLHAAPEATLTSPPPSSMPPDGAVVPAGAGDSSGDSGGGHDIADVAGFLLEPPVPNCSSSSYLFDCGFGNGEERMMMPSGGGGLLEDMVPLLVRRPSCNSAATTATTSSSGLPTTAPVSSPSPSTSSVSWSPASPYIDMAILSNIF